ncbi:hypothetical protein IB267_18045 [Ensifer sp. ENS09]|uniref:hypothetical protein n=1 Tax=Ensifer sp. ENS09 TaxID=2769263 RepID=UPI0017805925|nr:hypothetical protein [Ensifer sp. ENS09]MBD9650251.1 hypothetical protein [Ensifer sp. ENS09]
MGKATEYDRSELQEHFADLEDDNQAEDVSDAARVSAAEEIASLRLQVEGLRARLLEIRGQTEGIDASPTYGERHPWLRVAATAALAFVITRVFQQLRLGAAGAAAVPMITARFDRRFW